MARQRLQQRRCIKPGFGEQRLIGMIAQHGELLLQCPIADAVRRQLTRPGRQPAQAGLHAERGGDGREVERHGSMMKAKEKGAEGARCPSWR
jgi:hypothetical protein